MDDEYLSFIEDTADVTDAIVLTKRFKTANDFSKFIEETADKHDQSCLDTIIGFCEDNEIEYESVAQLVNCSLKDRIRSEESDLIFFKQSGKLPEEE